MSHDTGFGNSDPNYSPTFESLDEDDLIFGLEEQAGLVLEKSVSSNDSKNSICISSKKKNDNDDIPVKYCKYELFGICKSTICDHSHNILECSYVSGRKMNPSNKDMSRIINFILLNPCISHLNFGRNQLSKKVGINICKILMSNKHIIKSLALDSTFIGRQGFKSILECASKLSNLKYLDLSDLNLMPSKMENNNKKKQKNKKKNKKSQESIEMCEYQRKEVIDTIVLFLTKKNANILHLILGHNDFTYNECQKIIYAAIKYGGLITLDLYGNKLNNNELYNINKLLYNTRKLKILNLLINNKNNNCCKKLPISIANIICNYICHEKYDTLYRCHKWKPSLNNNKENEHSSISYKRRSL